MKNMGSLLVIFGGLMVCLGQQPKERIIFNSDVKSSDSELYSINIDGTGLKQLTFDAISGRGNEGGQLSPDRKYITFATYKYGGWKVALAKADFTGQKKWSHGRQYTWGASWAPDGKKLVYSKVDTKSPPYHEGDAEVFRMNLDGSGDTNLTKTKGLDHSPDWSPNGEKIVFYSDRDGNFEIYVMDPDGRNQVNLTNTPEVDEFAPSWSPNSRKIAYHSMRKTTTKRYIDTYVMDTDGKNRKNLTNNGPAKRNAYIAYYKGAPPTYGYQTCWSPKGDKVAFSSRRTGNFELYIANADGSGIKQFTNNGGLNMYPQWLSH